MDSGTYNHPRRGTMPHTSVSSSSPSTPTSSYKTNVNRTKTRKWVEAKVQNYDGDDWGNEYDEYDDGDDQYHEPEPLPPVRATTGLRQPGQTGYQLPSSRTFSQPSTSSFSSTVDPRIPTPFAHRSPSGPSSFQGQTRPTASTTTFSPLAINSSHTESRSTTIPSQTNVHVGPQSVGPSPTPSRFPPRKSSMGHQDRPDAGDQMVSKTESRPGSSSSNRPWTDQRSTSPAQSPPATKTLPFVRPSDIYRRMGEEKEKERSSLESGRPSMDSIPSRAESPGKTGLLSGEQRRRTSFESHDGSESARTRKSTLAPVAERKSEYGMEGLLPKEQAEKPPVSNEAALPILDVPASKDQPNDEMKADLLKSRRFSTSPQLPNLTRVSGFGDDFFSNPGNYSSQASSKLSTPSEEPRSLSTPSNTKAVAMDHTENQQPSSSDETGLVPNSSSNVHRADVKVEATKEVKVVEERQKPSVRPQLPGTWVSESTAIATPLEQPTPLENQQARTPTPLAVVENAGTSPTASSDTETSETTTKQNSQLSSDISEIIPKADVASQSAGQNNDAARQRGGSLGSEVLALGGYYTTPQSLSSLPTENSHPQPSSGPTSTATVSEFTPTAPLNPKRADAGRSNVDLPSSDHRKSTVSTIETTFHEKESDKLREEIIKSLSPAPISPGTSGLPMPVDDNLEPAPGSLTRESTYLSGVYDDYLSMAEDKSLQEVSQEAKNSAQAPNQTTEPENGSDVELQGVSVSQPEPPSPVKSHTVDKTSGTRRFSWQQGEEEVALSPVIANPPNPALSRESPIYSLEVFNTSTDTKPDIVSPASDSLQAGTGGVVTISHQVSQVSSCGPGDAPLSAIEPPSPVSYMAARSPGITSGGPDTSRLSLADEKEKALTGDSQSTTSGASDQHPALTKAPEPEDSSSLPILPVGPAQDVSIPPTTEPTLMSFRDILNLATCEQRVQKFDETRELFFGIDSGLSTWLTHLHSQSEHADTNAIAEKQPLLSKPMSAGAPGAPQLPFHANKAGGTTLPNRRTSIGGVQQLMGGQAGNFSASGVQVGTKSKELLHAAGVFGNKGVKSGMKLFNKGKNKLRERAAGGGGG